MELSNNEAYEILKLVPDSTFNDIIREYKYLALEWFPDRHGRNPEAIKKFEAINQAFLTLCSSVDPCKHKLLTLEEMMSLFQFIFFGNDSSDDSAESSNDEEEENTFGDFYVNPDSDDEDSLPESLGPSSSNDCSNCDVAWHGERRCNGTGENGSVRIQKSELLANEKANELIEEEEKEKRKADKKKAQKKRRKEKKKQEKSAGKKQNEVEKEKAGSEERSHGSSDESEEDIDPESAFVATIAKKAIKYIPLKKEANSKNKLVAEVEINEEEQSSRILRSREIALRGNEMANLGHYQEAIELFSEAIGLDPTDHRFYGNRSYCHESLGNSERALKDAEKSTSLAPSVPKGYFRKGKALLSLNRLAEAESCFKEVLRLDPLCQDAVTELSVCQVEQITEMGFSKEQALSAIKECGSVVGALNFLLPATTKKDEDLFDSDDEDEYLAQCSKQVPSAVIADVKMDPKNPEGHNSIWVGNLQAAVSENMITSLFAKYGEIISIKFTPEKFYAFINYKNKASTGKAMQSLQGMELFGAHLLIRYPNTKPSTAGKQTTQDPHKPKIFVTPINGNECYFWRRQGCYHGGSCQFKHIQSHKGIDLKKTNPKL